MSEEKNWTPRAPNYSGSGVAIWKAVDRQGTVYLNVSVLGGKPVKCFKVPPKPVVKEPVDKEGEGEV